MKNGIVGGFIGTSIDPTPISSKGVWTLNEAIHFKRNSKWDFANKIFIIAVAGGGGGEPASACCSGVYGGGGGGAGGLVYTAVNAVAGVHTITVGAGGPGGSWAPGPGSPGSNTTIVAPSASPFIPITCFGGGSSVTTMGGSGYGSLGFGIPGQGNPGGRTVSSGAGGGGGYSSSGTAGSPGSGGNGGTGLDILPVGIVTTSTTLAAGGGGGGAPGGGSGGSPENFGGSFSGPSSRAGGAGAANSGNGGGGGAGNSGNGGAGGSGRVMIWHATTSPFSTSGSGGGYSSATRTINGTNFTVHTFTTSGTFTIT